MGNILLRSLIIENFDDRNEILDELSGLDTDNDFNGENGKEYMSAEARKKGYDSEQDFVIDELKKTDLNGFALIEAFLEQWLDSSSYYDDYDFIAVEHANATIITIAIIIGD